MKIGSLVKHKYSRNPMVGVVILDDGLEPSHLLIHWTDGTSDWYPAVWSVLREVLNESR